MFIAVKQALAVDRRTCAATRLCKKNTSIQLITHISTHALFYRLRAR